MTLVLGSVLLSGGGCTSSDQGPSPFMPSDTVTSTVDRDSALAVLTSMRRTAFDSAFTRLSSYTVTRSVRTEQMTPAGTATAVRSYEIRYPPGTERGTIQRRDSSGAFRDGGLFGRVAPEADPAARPENVAAQILPDQPAYVEPRTREAFRYALTVDDVGGTPVYTLEATARSYGTGQDQGVRFARLRIHRSSNQLVGLTLVRDDQVLLFGEDSRMSLDLQRTADGAWVPRESRVRAVLRVPFRTPRRFRTVSTYSNYRR